MARMTEEEADALDEYYTQNPPRVDPAKKGGFFTSQRELLNILDGASADYIMTRAAFANKLPAQVINEMARECMAAGPVVAGK